MRCPKCFPFLSAVFLTIVTSLNAADLKLMGGLAYGKYSEKEMSFEFKRGYLCGIGLESGSGRLSFEIDALYFLKTSRYVSRGWDYELREISVPLLAKLKVIPGLNPVYVLAGGEVAYVISHRQFPGPFGAGTYWDATESTRKIDYGAVFGAGLKLELDGIALELESRYHHGLVNTTKFLNDGGYQFKTREWVFALGIKFQI